MIADTTIGLTAVLVDRGELYWLENRPSEEGRVVLVHHAGSSSRDVSPRDHSIRSRVHEYGGLAALVADGTAYYVNLKDQFIYAQAPGEMPRRLAGGEQDRYADLVMDAPRGRLIAVRERHTDDAVENALVAVSLDSGDVTVLDGVHDFVSTPRVSPDGRLLSWVSWDLPDMPWDAAAVNVAAFDAKGGLEDVRRIAGGGGQSVFQPEWHSDGRLIFVSDPDGWWNLQAWDGNNVPPLAPMEAEFGLPQWAFGMRTYDILPSGDIACAYFTDGHWQLALVSERGLHKVDIPYTDISGIRATGDVIVFIGASAHEGSCLVRCDPRTGECEVIRRSSDVALEPEMLSVPEAVTFPTSGGAVAHGFYYSPRNATCQAPVGEAPPLIVRGHGGPTGSSSPSFSLAIQYWTTRGFAVLDVNYRGSTGFGRDYREALYGQWGVLDVDDMVAGAEYLVSRGLADPNRLAIRGGSAGGYTTLAALAFKDTFSAGASLYGIGDLMTLARDTHKFESRYLDLLIGPLPETEALYRERSPVNHVDALDCPVIFLQGSEDRVVPPNQAEAMVEALDSKNIPVAYILFEGEGHGFRSGANVRRALEAELAFYGRVLGFEPADDLPDIEIRNLDAGRT